MKIGFDGRFIRQMQTGNGVSAQLLLHALSDVDRENHYTVYVLERCVHVRQKNFELKTMGGLHASSHIRFLVTFPFELMAHPVDIFHAIFTVPFLPYRTETKFVLTLPEIPWFTHPEDFPASSLFSSQVRLTTRYSIRKTDRVITLTHLMKDRIVDYFDIPEGKVHVIPWGVDERFCAPAGEEQTEKIRTKLDLKRPYILCVGDLHPRKNQANLIRAYTILREKYNIPFNLVLAGREIYKVDEIYNLAQSSSSRHSIIFTGYITFDELRALYQCASIFVFPSLHEGFGLPVHEAMASGVPVVSSDRDALPEVAGDAALFVDPLDADSIAAAILRVIEDTKLREEMIARGHRQVQQFSWKESARKLLALYRDVYAETYGTRQ